MLENCKTARERWGGTHQIIDRWLNQRQETLVRFFDISSDTAADKQSSLLQAFCESLMDYVSAGHFEVFEQLIREAKEFDDGGLELARTLYPKIEKTTQVIVDFNDKYDTLDHTNRHVNDLPVDLSELGEAMTERFEMEDQMIQRLHTIHKVQIA